MNVAYNRAEFLTQRGALGVGYIGVQGSVRSVVADGGAQERVTPQKERGVRGTFRTNLRPPSMASCASSDDRNRSWGGKHRRVMQGMATVG